MFAARIALCFMLIGLLGACNATTGVQYTTLAQADTADAFAAVPASPRSSTGAYLLGPGDRVRVKVYGDADLSGEYEISGSGAISLPLVGQVHAAGLTTQRLEERVTARMKGKLANDPHVSIDMATYAPFYIYGEVKKAGEYQYHLGLTVADAIALAGGLTYRADERRVFIRRAGAGVEYMLPLDRPTKVYPGDNIRVAESFF